jgi:hypothetical protein
MRPIGGSHQFQVGFSRLRCVIILLGGVVGMDVSAHSERICIAVVVVVFIVAVFIAVVVWVALPAVMFTLRHFVRPRKGG